MQSFNGKPLAPRPEARTSQDSHTLPILPFEAVIMAGGRGERMRPLTDNLPKPLLPVGGRPIVEYNLQRLIKAGVRDFTFCVNYLGEKIQAHFGDGSDWGAAFEYVMEPETLGTIGGVSRKEQYKYGDLLVINGDLLTTLNFERFYTFYLEQDADLAVATIPHRISLSYGTLELEGDQVKAVQEKPTYTYNLNSGIYLMRRELVDLIPQDRPYDAIDLIEAALRQNCKVVSFPLLEYWIDIGQMEDYQKAQKDIRYLDL